MVLFKENLKLLDYLSNLFNIEYNIVEDTIIIKDYIIYVKNNRNKTIYYLYKNNICLFQSQRFKIIAVRPFAELYYQSIDKLELCNANLYNIIYNNFLNNKKEIPTENAEGNKKAENILGDEFILNWKQYALLEYYENDYFGSSWELKNNKLFIFNGEDEFIVIYNKAENRYESFHKNWDEKHIYNAYHSQSKARNFAFLMYLLFNHQRNEKSSNDTIEAYQIERYAWKKFIELYGCMPSLKGNINEND